MTASLDLGEHFKTTVANDIMGMVLGNCRGAGTYRVIFDHANDPTLLCKVEPHAHSFSNIREYDVWQAVRDTKFARWFAPVVSISAAGCLLIMRRCEPARETDLPAMIPAFFTDIKRENWGILDGNPVCLDYGSHLMLERGMTGRMRKADWRD